MKVVSPASVHKTEVGGVKILDKTPEKIRATRRSMMAEIPMKLKKNRLLQLSRR